MTGIELFIAARPDVVIFALVALVPMAFLWYAARQTHIQWIDTVVKGALDNLNLVDVEQLSESEYAELRDSKFDGVIRREQLIESLHTVAGLSIPMSDVWCFKLKSAGGSSVTWFMRPETDEFLVPYTMINDSKNRINLEYQRKLKDVGGQAFIRHKMMNT